MLVIRRICMLSGLLALTLLSACTASYTPFLRSEPAVDSVLTRAPRTIRLFYNALPDVEQSSLSLTGPAGEYRLRGMHSMASDDLMIEILEPAATDGDYTVQWTTVVADDPSIYTGSYSFTVSSDQ